MNYIFFAFFTRFRLALITMIALFGVTGIFTMQAYADDQAAGGRLITIHDRGTDTVLLSKGETIADAIKDAGIELDGHDAVEPAANEKMVASEYNVNIYRARPVMVVDGVTRQKVITPYQTAEQIATDAGITMNPEDVGTLTRVDDILDGAGLQMVIDRATPFSFTLYGTTSVVRTQATTVGDMLKDKGVALGRDDRVMPDVGTPLSADMSIRVWREGTQTITVDEPVAFDVEQIKDADREVGYKAVQTPGQNGSRKATYEIVIQDGTEVRRTEINSLVVTQPVKQVEVVGTKSRITPYTGGGNKSVWLAASNIPEANWGAADAIISQESGWNPNATNRSSGACGLAQALPCSKVPGNPYDPVNSLNWMNGYVNGRYGGWEKALAFKRANGWY